MSRVLAKLATEPVEDLRIDFEDGYGDRGDDEEDAAAEAAGRGPRHRARRGHRAAVQRDPDPELRATHAGAGAAHPGRLPRGARQGPSTASWSPCPRSPRSTRSRRWCWPATRVDAGWGGRRCGSRSRSRHRSRSVGADGRVLLAPMVRAGGGPAHRPSTTAPTTTAPACGIAAGAAEPRAPGRRPRQGRDAGGGRRDRRAALRRLDQPAARRRQVARRGRSTTAWSGGRSSAASTRGGTSTRPSCRPGTRRRTPSSATGSARRRTGCAPTSSATISPILDEPATARALSDFLVRGLDWWRPRRDRGGHRDRARALGDADEARPDRPEGALSMGIRLGRQPLRQGREPGRPGRARHRAPRDPRPQRLHLAAGGLRRSPRRRRPVRGAAHRHPEEHRLRLRQAGRGRRSSRTTPSRSAAGWSRPRRPRPGPGCGSRSTPGTGFRRRRGATTTRSSAAAGRSAPRRSTSTARRARTVTSGLTDLVVLKSTGSEFKGFLRDEYTTLPEADDRVLATSLTASWRWSATAVRWRSTGTRRTPRSGRRCWRRSPRPTAGRCRRRSGRWAGPCSRRTEIEEISFAAPNKHHHLVDLAPFGLENDGEVFIAADRPYGLIEATVTRDGTMTLEDFNALPEAEAESRCWRAASTYRAGSTPSLEGRPYADSARSSRSPRSRRARCPTTSSSRRWRATPGSANAPAPDMTRPLGAASRPGWTATTPTSRPARRRQPGLRGPVRPGVPDPRRRPRRPRDPRPS